jgi:hypothetical protein
VKGNKLFLYTQKTGTPVYVPRHVRGVAAGERRVDRERVGAPRSFIGSEYGTALQTVVKTLQKKLEDEVRKAWS